VKEAYLNLMYIIYSQKPYKDAVRFRIDTVRKEHEAAKHTVRRFSEEESRILSYNTNLLPKLKKN
jgi:hypothetical protein